MPDLSTASDADAFDAIQLQKILELSEGEDDVAGEVISLFLSAAHLSVGVLSRAIADRDATRLRLCAHTLRGTSGVLGLKHVQNLATVLEESALKASDAWGDRSRYLSQLEQALVAAVAMLAGVQQMRR